jgi:tRNA-Thr(GGU) m(6)t(6)A37 methyltransferase TsaA
MKIELKPLATIQTPFESLENMPVQPCGADGCFGKIIFLEEYEKGLKDLEGFSHLYLLYYFHKVENYTLEVIPFNDHTNTKRGVFATRTPMHPNNIGLSLVELVSIEKNIVTVKGIDVLNNTPLLDIKPYIENFDKITTSQKSGWMEKSYEEVKKMKSDGRFVV